MSVPIGNAGVALIQQADALLERAAQAVAPPVAPTQPSEAEKPADHSTDPFAGDPGEAAIQIADAKLQYRIGAKLIAAEREADEAVLDIFA